jgi:hypothetical protein
MPGKPMRLLDDHLSDEELLLAIDGEHSAAQQAEVDVHLARCKACRARYARFEEASADLDAVYRRDRERDDPSVAEARAALQSRLREVSARFGPSPRGRMASALMARRQWVGPGVAVAATVLFAAALSLLGYDGWMRIASIEPDVLPVASLTPGATVSLNAAQICAMGTVGARTIPPAMRQEVLHSYGMEAVPADEYELDYLITPQLGGATNARNLWPQRYAARTWNAYVKDQLEDLLPRMVCARQVDLETAQHDIAVDWIAAYKKYFKTTDPLTLRARNRLFAEDDGPSLRLAALRIGN